MSASTSSSSSSSSDEHVLTKTGLISSSKDKSILRMDGLTSSSSTSCTRGRFEGLEDDTPSEPSTSSEGRFLIFRSTRPGFLSATGAGMIPWACRRPKSHKIIRTHCLYMREVYAYTLRAIAENELRNMPLARVKWCARRLGFAQRYLTVRP